MLIADLPLLLNQALMPRRAVGMDFSLWAEGFRIALQPSSLLYMVLGTVWGLFVGALPGLGAIFGISIMIPFTFYMPAATALIFLASIYSAVSFGDTWASVLVNAPGSTGSIATAWDGHPLAKNGRSGFALGIAGMASLLGGLYGWLILILMTPALVYVALALRSPDYAVLGLMALSLVALAAGGQTLKGLILAAVGLMVAFVGEDPITGTARFTYGSVLLVDGLPIVAVMLGLFAFSEALVMSERRGQIGTITQVSGQVREGVVETLRRPISVVRAGTIGALAGAMPGVGVSVANIVAYLVEKRFSGESEQFGKGHPAGVLAPEVANNSCNVASLAPTLTLGIPGSAPAAIILGAMIIHGVQIGPGLFHRDAIGYTVFAGIFLAQVTFFVIGMLLNRWAMRIVQIPFSVLVPSIMVLAFVGTYSVRNRVSDIAIMVAFGILGFLFKKYDWPAACMVLGVVLGSIIETNYARAMLLAGDSGYMIFITRPISLTLLLMTASFLLMPYVLPLYRRFRQPRGGISK